MNSNVTIVTAFVSDINKRGDRNEQKYIDFGKLLLQSNLNFVLFLERTILNKYFNELINLEKKTFIFGTKEYEYLRNGNLTIILFEKTDNYLYFFDHSEFNVITDNPGKDTIEYMFVNVIKQNGLKWLYPYI